MGRSDRGKRLDLFRDGRGIRGDIVGREIAKVNVLGADALQTELSTLRGSNGREFRDEIRLPDGAQRLELGRLRVGDMMKVERLRDEPSALLICAKSGYGHQR